MFMKVERSPDVVRNIVRAARRQGQTIGVVPTMGALHNGHVSLIEAAARTCDFVVTTIFVNPTQFAPDEDFAKYPRTLEADLQKCRAADADLVFTPDVDSMYSPESTTLVRVSGLTDVLEGAHRPAHFDGVTTIVAKLFHITEPDQAFFGQKDYQQQLVLRRMTADLDFGLEIVTCPIVREADGLAMSSRNRYLSDQERETALAISRALRIATERVKDGKNAADVHRQMQEFLQNTPGLRLDYATIVDADRLTPLTGECNERAVALIAAHVGATRLIDNAVLRFPMPTS